MVYEARAGQVIVLGASSWRIEGDHARPRARPRRRRAFPEPCRSGEGEGIGRPYELGEAIGKFARASCSRRAPTRRSSRSPTSGPSWKPPRLSCASRRRRPGALPSGPHRRRRAVPRRDRRLARRGHPHAVRRARACARGRWRCGARACASRSASRWQVDLVGRRHRVPSARRRLAARDRSARPRSRRGSRILVLAEVGQSWRSSAPSASARTPRARRCSSRAAARASARRSGSSGSRRRACSRSRASAL